MYQAADRGYGNFNAFEADLVRRFTKGFTLYTNYVWSKALDVDSSDNFYPRMSSDLSTDCAKAYFDRKHVFKASGVYVIPIGRALSSHFLGQELLGGWQISGSFTTESGTATGVMARDLSNTGAYHMTYADQICNGNNFHGRSFRKWFDTSCFVQSPAGTLGNAGRNNIVGPRNTSLNASLAKSFSLGEPRALQFRVDSFGVLNHPLGYFPAYSQNVASSTFGQVTSVGGARSVQLSLKLLY